MQNVELSLADGDYKKVAGLESNIKLAASKEDPEGINFPAALEAMGSNKYFTETAPASWYLPAYLESLYPYLSDESKVTVTFNNAEKLPEYLTDFNGISTYELTSGDYKTVWGETVSASFLSPSTVSKIPALLKQAVENPADGAMRMVNYAYSETEPSIGGGGVIPNVYQKVSGMAAEGGNYVFVAPDKEGKLIPFGRLQDETKSYGYMAGTAVTVTDGLISSDVSNYVLTVTPTATGYSLQRPDEKFIYLSGTYNSFNLGTLPAVGGDWKFSQNADGTTSIVNVEKKKTVKLNEYNGSYSYGCYPPSTFGIYLNASMKGSDGDFTFQNIKLEGVTYAWKYDSQNNYWKASAFAGGVNNPTESWLVSTEIDLSGATTPSLSFDAAINFLNGNNRADFIEAKISADYVDNVTTATWATLNATWSEGKNWTFVNSGAIDLKDYVGKKVRLAFAYKSTSACAPTIEIKNISVTEPKNGYYADVYLYKEVPENEVETASAMMFASTRAAAKYNTSAVYRYDAATSTWKEYTTPDVTVAVLQPADYAKMGATYVSKPGETLPIYLKNAYPYAQADLTVAVVYYSSSSQAISATEFVYDGATWMELYNEAQMTRDPSLTQGRYSQDRIDATRTGINPYIYPDVDWADQIFKDYAMNQRANINISGGGPKVTYYMSLNVNHDTGLLDSPKYYSWNNNINNMAYNFQNNISVKVTPTTKIDLNMNAQIRNKRGPYNSLDELFKMTLISNPINFPAVFPYQEGDPHVKYGNAILTGNELRVNPYAYMATTFKQTDENTLNTSLKIMQDLKFITKGLSVNALINFKNWSSSSYHRDIKPFYYGVADNSYDPADPTTFDLKFWIQEINTSQNPA